MVNTLLRSAEVGLIPGFVFEFQLCHVMCINRNLQKRLQNASDPENVPDSLVLH